MKNMFGKIQLKLKKASPDILIGVGILGLITSAVSAVRATRKLDLVMKQSTEKIDEARNNSPETKKTALAKAYGETVLKVSKLYAPAVLGGIASVVCIISSNEIVKKRNAALSMAYSALELQYSDYREKVKEKVGEEIESDIYSNTKKYAKRKELSDIPVIDPDKLDSYSVLFTPENYNYQTTREYNLVFLKQQQTIANQQLMKRGHLYLNEVYDRIGVKRTKAGQIVGWVLNKKDEQFGDDYVDFNIKEVYIENPAVPEDSDAHYILAFLISPNVNGRIIERMFE